MVSALVNSGSGCGAADALDLPLQLDAELGANIGADGLAQFLEVGGGRFPVVDQEIRVLLGETRRPVRLAAPAGCVDQPPGAVALRVLERRAARLLANGLGGLPPSGDLVHAGPDRRR